MDPTLRERPGGTWYDGTDNEEQKTGHWRLWGAIAGLVVLGMSFGLGFLTGHAPVRGLERQTVVLEDQLHAAHDREQALLTLRHCSTEERQATEIQRLLQAGKPQVAAALVQVDLARVDPPACPQTRVTLGALGYSATMDSLFSQGPVSPLDHGPLLTWLSAERQAEQLGVPLDERLSPLSVAVQAYNAHMWELARAAFLAAWKRGVVGPGDVDEVASYYATLRNFGRSLLSVGSGSQKRHGEVLLRTADAISRAYGLERGEAHADLVRILGRQTGRWPAPDGNDPVLAARASR